MRSAQSFRTQRQCLPDRAVKTLPGRRFFMGGRLPGMLLCACRGEHLSAAACRTRGAPAADGRGRRIADVKRSGAGRGGIRAAKRTARKGDYGSHETDAISSSFSGQPPL